ncbi:anthrax toxin receptor-like [Cricetulus griseus]|uniref:Anthrax toxin receptor-like n=1 Tax=Cricetulus griseus TaxID=10029 RepID=A0A9J7J2T5_CRIGR|nr:anthrax toxin receptor-like [Cricetulus griseus]XP_027245118.1 anthrax toxin receptor-like [Cricetulus griseus]
MGIHIPRMPCLALFVLLLLLPLPISKARSFRYRGPGWKLLHRLGNTFPAFHQRQIKRMKQNLSQRQSGEDCQGVFDLYIILDKSGSVGRNWIHICTFTENLVKKFQNPKMRMSIIIYSTFAEVITPLTSDREAIRKGLEKLNDEVPEGFTHMQDGFQKANEQIRKATSEGSNINSVIIAMTDGLLLDKHLKLTVEEANKSRQMGATIFTVGVYKYDAKQMLQIADSPYHNFEVKKGFTALNNIVDGLASKSCIEVISVKPSYVCTKDIYQVNISGHGFKNTNDLSQVMCRFTFSDSRVVDESPLGVDDSNINCPGPKIQHVGEEVSLEVSLNNGISFIGNKLTITGINCGSTKPKEPPPPPPPPPQPEKEPVEECPPPPPTSPPAPPAPPPPSPVNPNPTVIVACCGCGNRRMEGNLDACCNYFHPSCPQMPLICCHPNVRGICPSATVINPSCLRSSRDCFHLTQQPCTSRIVLQPNRECFNISQAPCSQKIYFTDSPECFPVAQTLCSNVCLPNQECYTLNHPQSPCLTRSTKSPSRILPLLPPHIRQSLESFCHTSPRCQSSKESKF